MDHEKQLDVSYVRAVLSILLLGIFCVLLVLIFYAELPASMETIAATLLGALVGNLTSVLSFWFDGTQSTDSHIKHSLKNNGGKPHRDS